MGIGIPFLRDAARVNDRARNISPGQSLVLPQPDSSLKLPTFTCTMSPSCRFRNSINSALDIGQFLRGSD